jgi:hypothetical protein
MHKGMILGVVSLVMILLVVSLVVGQEDPDLSPVDVDVTVGNAVPTIVATYVIFDTDGTGTQNSDIITALDGDAGDNVNNIEVRFLVEDANGIGDLPGGVISFSESTASGQLGTGGVNIEVYATNPANDYGATDTILDAASCARLGACPDAGGCGVNQMEFTCTIPMDYFFEPGTIGLDPWVMTMGIADGSAATATTTRDFTYLSNAYFATSGSLSWASISLSSTDQVAGGSLDLTNYGNVDFTAGTVHGSDLDPDGGGSGDDMPVTSFSAGTATGIGGDALDPWR